MQARDRLKQRMIRDLVRENLDTVAGAPPAGLRRRHRRVSGWLLAALGATLVVGFSGPISSTASRFGRPRVAPLGRAAGESRTAPPSALPAPRKIDPALFQLAVSKIVIDPGHGGADPGAVTPSGLEEKAITLDIANRLRALLKDAPVRVVMTRPDDRTVSLERRVEIANAENADLFLSIHINSMPLPDRVGIETFYLGDTRDPETARFARAENSGSGYSLADFRTLLEGVYAGVRQDESRRFAATMQTGLFHELAGVNDRVLNRGIKTAPLVVLVGTRMPAILAEVSCVSNADEARRLATPEYRSEVARGLSAGLRAYIDPSPAVPAAAARRGAAPPASKGNS
jgi:N-acetylmuramoyl-L-alanine amidase